MEPVGRELKPRTFDPLRAAKWLAWLGAVVLVLGTIGSVYIATSNDSANGLFGNGARGSVYLLLQTEPVILISAALLWGVAVLLWTRSQPN